MTSTSPDGDRTSIHPGEDTTSTHPGLSKAQYSLRGRVDIGPVLTPGRDWASTHSVARRGNVTNTHPGWR